MAIKPFRADAGVQMATGTAAWNGATGVGGIYYKTGVGLVMRKTDNSEVTIGAGGASFPLTNATSTNTYTSAVADGGAAVGHDFDTTNAFVTDGDFVFRVKSNAVAWFTMGRASSQRKFTFNGDSDATGSGPVVIKSTSASAGLLLDAATAGGRAYSLSSSSTGVVVLADLTAGSNRWQMDSSGAWSPFSNGGANLGVATSNEVGTINAILTKTRRLAGLSAAPTIAAGAGAGTTPAATIQANSTDVAGQINLSTGTGPTINATLFTVTFNGTYATAPWVLLTPATNNTANIVSAAAVFVDTASTTTTTFVVKSNGTALTASTAYKWFYHVIQ